MKGKKLLSAALAAVLLCTGCTANEKKENPQSSSVSLISTSKSSSVSSSSSELPKEDPEKTAFKNLWEKFNKSDNKSAFEILNIKTSDGDILLTAENCAEILSGSDAKIDGDPIAVYDSQGLTVFTEKTNGARSVSLFDGAAYEAVTENSSAKPLKSESSLLGCRVGNDPQFLREMLPDAKPAAESEIPNAEKYTLRTDEYEFSYFLGGGSVFYICLTLFDEEAPDADGSSSDSSTSGNSMSESSDPSVIQPSPSGLPLPDDKYETAFFKDDLFIGDSIFTGLYLYGYLNYANVAAKVGYSTYGAYNYAFDSKGITAVDYAKQTQPKRVFVMIGSNSMGGSLKSLKDDYSQMMTKIEAACPESEICCISITPVTSTSSAAAHAGISNENIRDVNSYIKAMCEERGYVYCDFYKTVSDENGYFRYELAEMDGLHFMGKTYSYLLSELQTLMSGENPQEAPAETSSVSASSE